MINMKLSKVLGVGINDSTYVTEKRGYLDERLPSGKKKRILLWSCPYMSTWKSMLGRSYSTIIHSKNPTYRGCTVCDNWLTFSNFRKWMETQDWEGKSLDKDLLFEGNKVYSPETCVFVPPIVNCFIISCAGGRGTHLVGSGIHKRTKKFRSRCCNPFTNKEEHLGLFVTELEAHLAWKSRKHTLSCLLAQSKYVTDDRVRRVLLTRYQNYNVLEDHIR